MTNTIRCKQFICYRSTKKAIRASQLVVQAINRILKSERHRGVIATSPISSGNKATTHRLIVTVTANKGIIPVDIEMVRIRYWNGNTVTIYRDNVIGNPAFCTGGKAI